MAFLNPYNFISVTGTIKNKENKTPKLPTFSELESQGIRHDYWLKDKFSGRFVCELECKTPTVVGNEHDNKQSPSLVEAYKFDNQIALPANSLRGMVSAIAETLSQSALRVLDDSSYSVRKGMRNSLSAIGELRIEETKNEKGDIVKKYFLKPLCLPTLQLDYKAKAGSSYPKKWQVCFGERNNMANWLPAYINGYKPKDVNNPKLGVKLISDSFLEESPKPLCYHGKTPKFFYAKLTKFTQLTSVSHSLKFPYLPALNVKITEKDGKQYYSLIGQKLVNEEIISAEEYIAKESSEQKLYTRGILHILGITGRDKDIPTSKKHEKFIPFPEFNNAKEKEIPEKVIDDFIAISKQRADASKKDDVKLPFLPEGYREYKGEKYWLPESGELVYFDIDNDGNITEISYSSIWRKKIDGTVYDAFEKINPNLLPWGNEKRDPEKSKLTPAELLFGVVAEQKINDEIKSYNFASRVKFSDAKALKTVELLPAQTLKILASPKPPSPAMYFESAQNGYVAKKDLNLNQDKPNGRKFYLHHPQSKPVKIQGVLKEDWETKEDPTKDKNLKQKLRCTPIKVGTKFYFHIDFDNLSWDELSLLEKALNPDKDFVHRLGLGKPLGLGSVKLEIKGLFFIDRLARYKSLDAPRYSAKYQSYEWFADLEKRYPLETQAAKNAETKQEAFSSSFIDTASLSALTTIGNPVLTANKTVTYPYSHTKGQNANEESEGFHWFVKNERSKEPKFLKPITDPLPTLDSN